MARKRTSRSRKKSSQSNDLSALSVERWLLQKEVWGLILTALGAVTIISLVTRNQGKLSDAWSLLLRQIFGVGAFPIGGLLVAAGILLLLSNSLRKPFVPRWQTIVGWEMIFFAGLSLVHILMPDSSFQLAREGQGGGYLGWSLVHLLDSLLGRTSAFFIIGGLLLGGVYVLAGIPLPIILWRIRWLLARMGISLRETVYARRVAAEQAAVQRAADERAAAERAAAEQAAAEQAAAIAEAEATRAQSASPQASQSPPGDDSSSASSRSQKAKTTARSKKMLQPTPAIGKLPSLNLLVADAKGKGDDADARQRAQIIEDTLEAFGIPAQVVEWNRGPVVTQFGVEPGYIERKSRNGGTRRYKVRVSKILSLTNDLALALAATPIRIEAPVPGRSVIGIEVPNGEKAMVGLRGVLESEQFAKLRAQLRIALGRDVSGEAVVADLAKMPHLLIAGATGSGKSVCLNAMIVSLLFFNRPEELQLLLIDPKRVELTKYDGIPHLIAPVVVEIEKVILSLRWLTKEMDRRYKELAKLGARNVNGYNRIAEKKGLQKMPMIVVVIDELADVMLSAPDDVEQTICRLAQMARATGIHLVIATQRPSVDVVTGLIKANFPARISFAVTSQIDSRVILDTPGAEKLLGRGDMLFMPPDSPKMQRIQGCFVSDREVDALVSVWQRKMPDKWEPEEEEPPWEGMSLDDDDSDEDALQDAIELVRQHEQASASFLQRQMRIGYPRAARLIDELEARGIVGPAETGGRSRQVLDYGEDSEDDNQPEPAAEGEAKAAEADGSDQAE